MSFDPEKPKPDQNPIEERLSKNLFLANEIGKQALLENKKRRQQQWTAEKRAEQAGVIQQRKPWEHTTGPKTQAGKARSSQNAYKHGYRGQDYAELLVLLRQQELYRRYVHRKMQIWYEWCANNPGMETLQDLYVQTKKDFAAAGIDTPDLDARILISHHSGLDHADFILSGALKISDDTLEALARDIERRKNGEPVSRILGVREFWGLEFKVTPDVLDPRPDTETLVEAVLKWAKAQAPCPQAGGRDGTGNPFRILDLGTGTGCIPIALLSELPNATAVGVDISHAAALVAQENAVCHGMADRLRIVQGSWMEALKEQSFDVIVSNPPYIAPSEIEKLSPEVKNHDPILALKADKNGFECYEKIFSTLKNHLHAKNRAYFEIGFDQLEGLTGIAEESNLCVCDSYPDIAGIPRVVEICRGDK